MTTAQEFRSTIGALMDDNAVAGISVTSEYESLLGNDGDAAGGHDPSGRRGCRFL